jgi:adenosine deaminase
VAFSSDDPLIFMKKTNPHDEETSFVEKYYNLSPTTMSETFRASILMSTYPEEKKKEILGEDLRTPKQCNIPPMRLIKRDALFENTFRKMEEEIRFQERKEMKKIDIESISFVPTTQSRSF